MNRQKVVDLIEDRIKNAEAKLQALRDEYDRVDANNPHRSIEITKDIELSLKFIKGLHVVLAGAKGEV